ncbi:uncharacterized protein LOC135820796 [Sycon ciliatum]|uniref:uncharacterized protein LOC135820796 n=1 Tax=Sycon ciliatum TaxID=27933 RepID=UPI0031F606A1
MLISISGLEHTARVLTLCKPGYTWRSGQHSRVCQANGSWSGVAAICSQPRPDEAQPCLAGRTNTTRGTFDWHQTSVGVNRTLPCPIVLAGQAPKYAYRSCLGPATWSAIRLQDCPYLSERTRGINLLSEVAGKSLRNATSTNSILTIVDNITVLINDDADLSNDELGLLSTILDDVVESTVQVINSQTQQASDFAQVDRILSSFLNVVSRVASDNHHDDSSATGSGMPPQTTPGAGEPDASISQVRIAVSLTKLVQSVPIAQNQELIRMADNVGVAAVCPEDMSGYSVTVDDGVGNSNGSEAANSTSSTPQSPSISVRIRRVQQDPELHMNGTTAKSTKLMLSIPAEAVDIASRYIGTTTVTANGSASTACKRATASFVMFFKSQLFPSTTSDGDVLASKVIAAKVGTLANVNLSSSSVVMVLPVDQSLMSRVNSSWTATCAFWDTRRASWSSAGCRLLSFYATNNGSGAAAQCSCNHMTNFALLVRPPQATTPGSGGNDGDDNGVADRSQARHTHALSTLTMFGCGMSSLCLCFTIFIIVSNRDLRIRQRQQLTLGMSVALLSVMILFASSESAVGSKHSCRAVASLLHYSLLSLFCWMGAQATLLYKQLVRVFDTVSEKFTRISVLASALGPLLVVAATAISTSMQAYTNRAGLCFISTDMVFYVTFFGPMVLMVVYNTLIIARVIGIVMSTGNAVQREKGESGGVGQTMFYVRIVTSLSVLVGVTWLLGLLVAFVDSVALQYLFCVVNSFQGCAVFYFYTLTAKEVHEALRRNPRFALLKPLLGCQDRRQRLSAVPLSAVTTSTNSTSGGSGNNNNNNTASSSRAQNAAADTKAAVAAAQGEEDRPTTASTSCTSANIFLPHDHTPVISDRSSDTSIGANAASGSNHLGLLNIDECGDGCNRKCSTSSANTFVDQGTSEGGATPPSSSGSATRIAGTGTPNQLSPKKNALTPVASAGSGAGNEDGDIGAAGASPPPHSPSVYDALAPIRKAMMAQRKASGSQGSESSPVSQRDSPVAQPRPTASVTVALQFSLQPLPTEDLGSAAATTAGESDDSGFRRKPLAAQHRVASLQSPNSVGPPVHKPSHIQTLPSQLSMNGEMLAKYAASRATHQSLDCESPTVQSKGSLHHIVQPLHRITNNAKTKLGNAVLSSLESCKSMGASVGASVGSTRSTPMQYYNPLLDNEDLAMSP